MRRDRRTVLGLAAGALLLGALAPATWASGSLGMSVRTCRRHIAEITEQLEATSRFQAGYNAARQEMRTGESAPRTF